MKSCFVYIFVVSIWGGAACARVRRQDPTESKNAIIPDAVADADPTPDGGPDVGGGKSVKGYMLSDVSSQSKMGVPVNPDKLGQMMTQTGDVKTLGTQIANPSKEGLSKLSSPPAGVSEKVEPPVTERAMNSY